MRALTEKQTEILTYIVEYGRVNLRQPTLREIADVFSISPEGVRGHLLALERKQLIEVSGKGPRGIEITDEAVDIIDAL